MDFGLFSGRDVPAGQAPESQVGSIPDPYLAEYPVEILLDRGFGKVQFKGNFFIQFRLRYQLNHLAFAEGQFLVSGIADARSWLLTALAQVDISIPVKSLAATGTVLQYSYRD
jgi:hypothetical protein